jgi:hypothetical protein
MKKLIFENYNEKKDALDKLKQEGIKFIANGWWGYVLVKDSDEELSRRLVNPKEVEDCPELRASESFAQFLDMYNGGGTSSINVPQEYAIVIQENGWSNLLEYSNLICQTDDLTLICIDQDTKHSKPIHQV